MMVGLITQAGQTGARLIVLPELCTSGYSFMSPEDARPYAEVLDGNGRTLRTMQGLSRAYGAAIVWGMPVADSKGLYNAQVIVLPNGEWKTYCKLNPWGNDFLWSLPGRESPPIVSFLGKKIGLLICRDIRDKSTSFKEFYEKGDADIVAFSANFGDGGFPAVSWMDFAKDNNVWLAVSNRYGQETCNNFGEGGICVIEPPSGEREYGPVHCRGLRWEAPCVVYADVP